MNERLAAGQRIGEVGRIVFESERLVTHLIALDERSDRPAPERRRTEQIHLRAGGHKVRQQVGSNEPAAPGHRDPARDYALGTAASCQFLASCASRPELVGRGTDLTQST